MSPFNRRLSPHRVLGLPLGAATMGLVALSGTLLSVVLPSPFKAFSIGAALCALPIGVGLSVVGDDIVFVRVFWMARCDERRITREGSWL